MLSQGHNPQKLPKLCKCITAFDSADSISENFPLSLLYNGLSTLDISNSSFCCSFTSNSNVLENCGLSLLKISACFCTYAIEHNV